MAVLGASWLVGTVEAAPGAEGGLLLVGDGAPGAKPPMQQKTISSVVKEGNSELKRSWSGERPQETSSPNLLLQSWITFLTSLITSSSYNHISLLTGLPVSVPFP